MMLNYVFESPPIPGSGNSKIIYPPSIYNLHDNRGSKIGNLFIRTK